MIKYAQGDCGIEELEQVKEALEYGYFGMAYKVSELENEIKKFLETDYDVACVNTGTSAIHLALDAIGIKSGDEVILPSFTFVATAQAVTACGGIPVFVDINNELTINPSDIESKITDKTKAILVVHYNGQPVDLDPILEIAKKNNLRVVEDAAHAFGSYYKNKKIGSFGDIVCFSFDSIKIMTCGEGGALISGDTIVMDLVRKKRLLGMQRSSMTDINWKNRSMGYDVVTSGHRYHMSNINASIGLAQIKKVKGFIEFRRLLVKRYRDLLAQSKLITFYDLDYFTNANFMMIVKVNYDLRDDLKKYLLSHDIESSISYIPIHKFSFYSRYQLDELKITDRVYSEILSLPLHTKMSFKDVEYIVDIIKEFENEKNL